MIKSVTSRKGLRSIAVGGMIVALSGSLLMANPAQAAKTKAMSEDALASSSVKLGDLPRWMINTADPSLTQMYKDGRRPPQADLCLDANGAQLLGPRPKQYMESVAITRENVDELSAVEINSNIYQYANRSAAVRAWNRLNVTVAKCAANIDLDIEEEGVEVKASVKTEVETLPVLFGRPGVGINLDVTVDVSAGDLTIDIAGDQVGHYYLAGQSIIRVEYANINGASPGSISRVNREFVSTLAIVVAQRIERRSAR
ncbi:MAG: hypothetical protein WAO40_01680 [Candidatus Nanopelagicales bacterium]